jgi:tetratricopeptide (TPR) repeat protein
MNRALLILVLLASPAAAQPEAAKPHFLQGKAYQDTGQFDRAADEYKEAYRLDPRPEMLFNIAQAYRLGKKKPEAVEYFKKYLAEQPDGAGATEARTHVATLTKEIDEEAALKKAPPPTMLPPEPIAQPPVQRDEPEQPGKKLRIAGLVTAGVGVLSLGLGIKFGLDAKAASDDITNHTGPWTKKEEDRFDEGERANRNMKIAYVVGGVLVVGGGVMFYLGVRAKAAPVVTDQSASLVVTGEF